MRTGAVALALIVISLAAVGVAQAASKAGEATIVTSGGSGTRFSIRLPAGAACTKDTAAFNYHVYGYLLGAAAYPDPGRVNFSSDGPVGNGTGVAYPLVDDTGSPYIAAATAQTTGLVINLPRFDFEAFSVGGTDGRAPLPAGTYRVGIACADEANVTDKFWNATLTTTAGADGAIRFVVPGAQVRGSSSFRTMLLSGMAALGAGLALLWRRGARSPSRLASGAPRP